MTTLLCISGSLRAASTSRAVVSTLCARLEGQVSTMRFDIGSLPHYNADLPSPETVDAFKEAIETADGLVIVTPEYNYGIPGVLKNAIDWASRPAYASVLKDKPVFVASVSGGALGGVRAQAHLKYVLNGTLARVFTWQEVVVPHAAAKVENGFLVDEATEAFLLEGAKAFIRSLER
ncbi:NADPH-dependent FMN reductase [Chelativorans alearense]|uniref:NADPH-dependent FMN reductase n=1 Tax=Chelativorans alearense TaxID=2681495 RepID=UPI0013D87B33|nr:NADPH-dependent FMN reductase [Chelativorans alearense]